MRKYVRSPWKIGVFLLVFLIAFFLRAQETISHNFLFLMDMGRDMMAVKSIVFDHHLTLIGPYTSLGGVFQGPLWYYLLAIPTVLTKGDPWGTIVLMLIISLSTAVVAFLWMKKLFGYNAAIITFFLISISPEAIAAATYSWNPHPMWLLLTIYVFLLYEIKKGKQRYHLFLWPVVALLFHFEAALGFFILLATIFYTVLFARKSTQTKYFLLAVLLAGLFFLPQIIFDLRHNFLMTKSVVSPVQWR